MCSATHPFKNIWKVDDGRCNQIIMEDASSQTQAFIAKDNIEQHSGKGNVQDFLKLYPFKFAS